MMKELLRTRGYKITPQRELIFQSFLEMNKHVSVEELYDRVRRKDTAIGHSTVWRNMKLICEVGLAEEVTVGDGVTRYDRVTAAPHGHFYCVECHALVEFDAGKALAFLKTAARDNDFAAETFKIEIQGHCAKCLEARARRNGESVDRCGLGEISPKKGRPS